MRWGFWRRAGRCGCFSLNSVGDGAFDEETLEEGSIICENCGEKLEFSFEDDDEDEGLEF